MGGRIVPIPARSDLDTLTAAGAPADGFQIDQASEYHARAEAEVCTRCGKYPPRIDRKTCARCAEDQAERALKHRGPPKPKRTEVERRAAQREAEARYRSKHRDRRRKADREAKRKTRAAKRHE
ncbi:MAG: hypothetical protein F4018_03510 [Acidobacteria bacterium]|nr:hypothetical protein [Acidobacteriota bacterium]